MPDEWNAQDLKIIHGQIVMPARYRDPENPRDGLYTFDLDSGELSMLLPIPAGYSKLLYVAD